MPGANQTVNSGVTVTLNGTASSDANGTIATYAWTQTAGTPVVTLTNGTTAQPTFPAPTVATATMLHVSRWSSPTISEPRVPRPP